MTASDALRERLRDLTARGAVANAFRAAILLDVADALDEVPLDELPGDGLRRRAEALLAEAEGDPGSVDLRAQVRAARGELR